MYETEYLPFTTPTVHAKRRVLKLETTANLERIRNEASKLKGNYPQESLEWYILRDLACESSVEEVWGETRTTDEYINKFIEHAKDKLIKDSIEEDDLKLINLTSSQIRDRAKAMGEYYAQNQGDDTDLQEPLTARQMRKKQRYINAAIEMHLNVIGGNYGAKRATQRSKDQRIEMNESNQYFLENHKVTSKSGTIIKLKDIAITHEKRLNEIYVIANGIQKLAEAQGMKWASTVATLPPHLHINPTRGKKTWDGSLPEKSIKYFRKKWKRMRSYCAKRKITLTGFWTVEAHSDGTPHINFLVYFEEDQTETIRSAFESYFGHSAKAVKFRLGGEVEEGQKAASFASYALKYFTKTFNVNDTNSELYDAALSEEAWASSFGIRRYGFFGIPPLTHWRRLRASTTAPNDIKTAAMWRAARANDAQKYIGLNGGLGIKNKFRALESVRQQHKRSVVTVGVRNKKTGYEFITKTLGDWTISKILEAVKEVDTEVNSDTNAEKNTVKLNKNNGLHLNQVIQVTGQKPQNEAYKPHRFSNHPPPLAAKTLH